MAAKSQQGVRTVIHTLLSLLEDAGVPKIPSESFRKAKFNQPEVTETFWVTLLHIVHLTKTLESPLPTLKSIPDLANHCTENVRLFVRKFFFSLGYNRLYFFTDPVSRELVLAFAWLLHKTELPRKLTGYHLRCANTVRIPMRTGHRFLVEVMEKDIENFMEEVCEIQEHISNCSENSQQGKDPNIQLVEEALKKMAWLKGKVECRLNSALSNQQGYQKLAHKIHQYTAQPSSGEHLTVHEVFLLRHPEQLSSYLRELEKHLAALQRLMEWRACEPLFWQWMESVLDLDEKEKQNCSEEEKSAAKTLSQEELELSVRSLEREVMALVAKNQPHIDKINHTWTLKSRSVKKAEIEDEHAKLQLPLVLVDHRDPQTVAASTRAIEQLESMNTLLYLPPESSLKHQSRVQPLPSTLDQERAQADALQALKVRLEQVQGELVTNGERLKEARSVVARQLEAVEQTLPPSICKVEQ